MYSVSQTVAYSTLHWTDVGGCLTGAGAPPYWGADKTEPMVVVAIYNKILSINTHISSVQLMYNALKVRPVWY